MTRTLATFGLAAGAPVTLFSGMALLAMLPNGIPRALSTVFVSAAALTILSWVVYVVDDLARRGRRISGDG